MVVAALVFTGMVIAVKEARQSLLSVEVIFWRCVVAIPLVGALGVRAVRRVNQKRLLLARCFFGFCAVYCFVTAIKGLSIADVAILHKLQPVIVAVAAPLVLGEGEKSGDRVWTAIALGLGGSLLILQPSLGNAAGASAAKISAGLWAIAGACFSAAAHLCLRALGPGEDSRATVFWFQVSLLPLALAGLGIEEQRLPTWPELGVWPALLAVGVAAALGQLLITQAYRVGRAAPNAAASLTGPLWAYLADWAILGQLPTLIGLLGGACVVGAGGSLLLQGRGSEAGSA